MSPLTIVMYHYVRQLSASRFPGIKGLSLSQFAGQLDWLQAHHTLVSLSQVLAALPTVAGGTTPLPANAALLTFDDGYLDHYTVVFPELANRGLSGVFFPPVSAVRDRQLLPSNKVHALLAAVPQVQSLLTATQGWMASNAADYPTIASFEDYRHRLAVASRLDPGDVILIKRLLQRDLPEPARTALADFLIDSVLGVSPAVLAAEWYLTETQLRVMMANGMALGSHGVHHPWLTSLSQADQDRELADSYQWLRLLGMAPDQLTVCYPYGAFNRQTVQLAQKAGYRAGFTTEVRVAHLEDDDPLTLPRLDTVDLPFARYS